MALDKYKPWRDYLENILIAVFLALLVRGFILTGYRVPTSSMAPTLRPGDFVFAYRLPYGFKAPFMHEKWVGRSPQKGEVIVFTYPEQPRTNYIKRVVGLPGDVIQIKEGRLWINGKSAELTPIETLEDQESAAFQGYSEKGPAGEYLIYKLKESQPQNFGPLVVPPDEMFLLGDNRDASDDSRYWGTVPISRIEGRVVLLWLSLEWHGSQIPTVRWNRIFTFL